MTGTVVGYDPGGNCKHGLAKATFRDGKLVNVSTKTLRHVENVVASIIGVERPLGLGIDTLTCWGTGRSGWRPADRWLRERYPAVKKSVVAPSALFGAMSVNGMAVLVAVRQAFRGIFVTETHPKVLYYALLNRPWNFKGQHTTVMSEHLSKRLGIDIAPQNEHEWDSAISMLAVVGALRGSWKRDLHALPTDSGERLVQPCGRTAYVWPE